MENDELIELSDASQLDSIYFNKLSYFASKLSAGGAIETCRAVVLGKVKNAIAVIRPPGHHAEVSSTMGFCLFNNTCIASRVCQQDFEEKCRKILILDWSGLSL
jgi:histone deacetylase 6